MSTATEGHDEKRPTHSPIFPAIAISRIAKLEVHIQYTDDEGDKQWAAVPDLPVYASWADILRKAGGGFYKVAARGKGREGYIDNAKKRLHGPPKFLNEIRQAEAVEDDIADDENINETDSDVRAIIKQQAAILPSMVESVTTALVHATEAHSERMASMAQGQQNLVASHAAAIEALRVSYRAEIDGYRLENDRLRNRCNELERSRDTLTSENAGYLKTLANGKPGGSEIMQVVEKIGPQLPGLPMFIKAMRDAWKPEEIAAAAGNSTAPQLMFGGGK